MIKNHIFVDIYVIKDILKTSTRNSNEVVLHITHMMYGRKEGSFTFSRIYSPAAIILLIRVNEKTKTNSPM